MNFNSRAYGGRSSNFDPRLYDGAIDSPASRHSPAAPELRPTAGFGPCGVCGRARPAAISREMSDRVPVPSTP